MIEVFLDSWLRPDGTSNYTLRFIFWVGKQVPVMDTRGASYFGWDQLGILINYKNNDQNFKIYEYISEDKIK